MLDWLNKNTAAAILAELAAGERPLTHAGLGQLPDSKTIRHLRSVLVATGALPPRDEHMIRLQHWTTAAIASRDEPGERQLLHRYASWHALRRLRRRAGSQHATHGQAVTVQRHVRAAITLLDWLTAHGLELASARQGDLDAWLTSDHATNHSDAGNFVRWARRQKLTSLDFAATRWDGPGGIIDTEARWHHARRLLHDDTIKPEDRVAGLLVLLYAQGPAAISRLTLDQVHAGQQHVRLRLGREPVALPEPLDALVLQLAASGRGHAAPGDQGTSPGCSPAAIAACSSELTPGEVKYASSGCRVLASSAGPDWSREAATPSMWRPGRRGWPWCLRPRSAPAARTAIRSARRSASSV